MSVSHHHHNPLDPRDPLSPAFYYVFMASQDEPLESQADTGCGRTGLSGCGFLLLAAMAGVLIEILWH